MSLFHLPDLGEGLAEAEIVAWHVSPGQHVVKDQPLVSVETDKAVVEIPSPQSGRIAKLHGKAGDHPAVGALLVEFDEGETGDSGTVVGDLGAAPQRPRVAPAVRALARELGVELSGLAPSGAQGEITREDVTRAAGTAAVPGNQPLTGIRRAMARNMARSGTEIVPTTVTEEADVEDWPPKSDVTARLIRALVAACRAVPSLNVWYDGKAMTRQLHDAVHVGVAVETEEGLIVPVLRDAQRHDLAGLRKEIEALKNAARHRMVSPESLRGATITLSNFGTFGGRHATLVIMPPQVAILGAGRISPQVVARDGRPAVRRQLPLSLTFDHRVVSGVEATRFLQAVSADLQFQENVTAPAV